jgi:hypothetical protein
MAVPSRFTTWAVSPAMNLRRTSMTIPAHMIAEYLSPSMTTVSVRDSNGSACFQADLVQLEALIAAGTIVGKVRGKRLRYVQLLVPPDVAFRALGENAGRATTFDQFSFTYRENLSSGKLTVLKRYHAPTGAFVYWSGNEGCGSSRYNPDSNAENIANGPVRPPVAREIEAG